MGHRGGLTEVFPGRHTLARALRHAHDGDALELHGGVYHDAVTITKTVVIEPLGDGPVIINGQCRKAATIAVRADGVTLEGDMTVIGGQNDEVDIRGVASATIVGLKARDSCGTAVDGFDIDSVGSIFFTQQLATGFPGAGIRVSNITDTGQRPLAVIFNEATGGGVGIVVENSLPGTVHLEANRVHDNTIGGIQLISSDGVLIDNGNRARDDGTFGIEVDANSDNNVIQGNRAFGNAFDLANLGGTGNCFKHNRYETSEGDVSCSP
jgi:hypothetical protein